VVFCGNRHMRVMFEPPPPDAHGIGLGADARLQKGGERRSEPRSAALIASPATGPTLGTKALHR
jgi:hypothetical protein